MMHEFKAPQPPESRASTASSDMPLAKKPRMSIENDQLTITTVSTSPINNGDIKFEQRPSIQSSFTTTIKLQYGENLQFNCSIHLSCLLECSATMKQLFEDADSIRQDYAKVKTLRRRVKALLPPETSHEAFMGQKVDEMVAQALSLISAACSNFPLSEYKSRIRNSVQNHVDELFQDNKHNWNDPSIKRKDFPAEHVLKRLEVLKAHAILSVLTKLHQVLWQIKAREDKAALSNPRKAAAQRRIVLATFDEGTDRTVQSTFDQETIGAMMQWAYKGPLRFDNADQLCCLHALATRLGMDELTGLCVEKLTSATRKALSSAELNGISVANLLEETRSSTETDGQVNPLADVVRVVFMFVLKHENPPVQLKAIVLEAIADSADHDLVDTALMTMSSELKNELCIALVHRHWKINVGRTWTDGSIKEETKLEEKEEEAKEGFE